jgi:hypothetical protein
VSAVTKTREGTKTLEQGSLEEWTVGKAPQLAPQWSKDGLMEHIIELVVVDDQVSETSEAFIIYVT